MKNKRRKSELPALPRCISSLPGGATLTNPHLDAPQAQLRVLVADDESVVRSLYRDFLLEPRLPRNADVPGDGALDVALCSQAEEAVAEVARGLEAGEPFAIALLDVRMPPGRSGVWAAERIRALDPSIEIVIVTAHSDINPLDIASRVPPIDKLLYLQKPVHPHEISQCVAALASKWRQGRELRRSQAWLATAQRIARFAHWEWNPRNGHASWSPELNRIFGLPADLHDGPIEVLWSHVHPEDEGSLAAGIQETLDSGEPQTLGYRIQLADGRTRAIQHEIAPVAGQAENSLRLLGSLQDVTERRKSERQIFNLAYFDQVTQIPNRIFLTEQLPFVLSQAKRYDRNVALMYIDLDNFKRINDTFGHSAGDKVLSEVAERLKGCIRDSDCIVRPENRHPSEVGDTVARLGGDEFIVLLSEVEQPQDSARVAQRVLESLEAPVRVAGEEFAVHASIGISVFPADGTAPDSLLKNADAAMYHAKGQGRNNYQFYTESLNRKASDRLALEGALRHALARDELVLHYQPKVDLRDGSVVGAEALVRWEHPDLGLVSPESFLTAAEESGLIVPLGEWVLREACVQAKNLQQRGYPDMRIAVNFSHRQFRDRQLITRLRDALGRAKAAPGSLELEFSESVLMGDPEDSARILSELDAMGVRIAMDDFGTGYSSMKYLKRLPIGSVKIDGSLISEITTDEDDQAIVTAIIGLAHRMGLQVVAEGVEQLAQLQLLKRYGCDVFQGYLISTPLPADEFVDLFPPGHRLDWVVAASAA